MEFPFSRALYGSCHMTCLTVLPIHDQKHTSMGWPIAHYYYSIILLNNVSLIEKYVIHFLAVLTFRKTPHISKITLCCSIANNLSIWLQTLLNKIHPYPLMKGNTITKLLWSIHYRLVFILCSWPAIISPQIIKIERIIICNSLFKYVYLLN